LKHLSGELVITRDILKVADFFLLMIYIEAQFSAILMVVSFHATLTLSGSAVDKIFRGNKTTTLAGYLTT